MIDPGKLDKIQQILDDGLPLPTACSMAGADFEAVLAEIKSDPVLSDRFAFAMANQEQAAVQALIRAFRSGDVSTEEEEETREKTDKGEKIRRTKQKSKTDWRAAAWYLERVFGDRYGDKQAAPPDDKMKKTITVHITDGERAAIAEPLVPLQTEEKRLALNGNTNGNGHHVNGNGLGH